MNLFVDVQFGQAAALGVVGNTDGHRLGALGDRHCDLKQLHRKQTRGQEDKVNQDRVQKETDGQHEGLAVHCLCVVTREQQRGI